MRPFRDLTIRRKLVITMMLTSVSGLLLAGIGFLLLESRNIERLLRQDQKTLASVVGASCIYALDFGVKTDAEESLARLEEVATVRAACVYDREGTLFAGYRAPRFGSSGFPRIEADGQRLEGAAMVDFQPIMFRGARIGTIALWYGLDQLRALRRRSLLLVMALILLSLAAALIISMRAQRLIADPLLRLTDVAREVAERKNYGMRASREGDDEVGTLVDGFNAMLEAIEARQRDLRVAKEEAEGVSKELTVQRDHLQRVIEERARFERDRSELQHQLVEAQKMECVGRLAGGIAHDFNNILAVIMGFSELTLERMEENAPGRNHLEQVLDAAERAAGLTRQLLLFARHDVAQPKLIDVNQHVLATDRILRRILGEDIELVTLPGARLYPVEMDPSHLEQILMNLAVNARDAMPRGGKLTIGTGNVRILHDDPVLPEDREAGDYVLLSVADTGIGMGEEVRERIFEPFFTTKEAGKGTGLGLATCLSIIGDLCGFITVDSRSGEGTSFRIFLPASVSGKSSEESMGEAEGAFPGGNDTILIVEDEVSVRRMAAETLGRCGYTILEAGSGSEALRLLERAGETVHLVVSDLIMPEMGGEDLFREATSRFPQLRFVFMSGYSGDAEVLDGAAPLLRKPFLPHELARMVRQVLDRLDKAVLEL